MATGKKKLKRLGEGDDGPCGGKSGVVTLRHPSERPGGQLTYRWEFRLDTRQLMGPGGSPQHTGVTEAEGGRELLGEGV